MTEQKSKFEVLQEKISAQVGPPVFENGEKEKAFLNQQFFARLAAAVYKLIFEKTEGAFYLYVPESGLWVRQDDASMIDRVSLLMMEFANEMEKSDINSKRNVGTIKSILKFMQADACCGRENAFAHKGEPFIHCGNGVITFSVQADGRRKPVLMPFDPKYMSRNRTEYIFREDAVCPEFKDRLIKPAMSEDDLNHFQQYVAQCLLGVNRSQTILLMVGTAGGGKSTAVNIVEKLVNRRNCTELRLEHMGSRFETQRLLGKTLLTAKDVPSDYLATKLNHKLKALSGKDSLTIERKCSNDASDICGEFNVIITANNTLHVALDGDVGAWERRLILIEYNNPPPKEKIADFDDYLLAREGDGILMWAVEGAMLLLENDGKIVKSKEQEKKIKNLLHESDPVAAYLKSHLDLVDDKDATVTSEEILKAFHDYCKNQGWTLPARKVIQSEIPDYIFHYYGISKRTDIKRAGTNRRGYYGLKLK